jgi:hypothetical protein
MVLMISSNSKKWKTTTKSITLQSSKTIQDPTELVAAMWDKYYDSESELTRAEIPFYLPNLTKSIEARFDKINKENGGFLTRKAKMEEKLVRVRKAYSGQKNTKKRLDEECYTVINFLVDEIKRNKKTITELEKLKATM